MAFASWLRSLPLILRPKGSSHNRLFLDAASFRFELARERMRVDRNGSPMAVLAIELPADRAAESDFKFLGRVLKSRLRITDTVGHLSERQVGALLTDTSKSGAWKVASDICSVYPVGHDRPNCDVFMYPDDSTTRRDGSPQRELEPSDEPAAVTLESLLQQPTPKWKRAIDVTGAMVGLIVSSPLLLLAAVAIKLTSRGPVFFSQEREGLGGERFRIHKLRTMHLDAHAHQSALRSHSVQDGPAFKMHDDPRTTWIGGWLRATSFDEVPQFWNVLKGEMSLVGPRPLPVFESLQCSPWQRRRLCVVPGMTCIWQVKGRNTVTFDQWMRMDLEYVRRRSFLYDMGLLLTTAPSVVIARGAR